MLVYVWDVTYVRDVTYVIYVRDVQNYVMAARKEETLHIKVCLKPYEPVRASVSIDKFICCK